MPKNLKFLVVLIFIVNTFQAKAQLYEQEATPEKNLILEKEQTLILTEINFKNKKEDYIKFRVNSDNNSLINLKGLGFKDDKTFKIIEDNFFTSPQEEITLYFNNAAKDQVNERKLFTSHKGLTGTTEQIILHNDKTIYSLMCWKNKEPAKAEIEEFKKHLLSIKNPIFKNIEDCFDSEKVKENESIVYDETKKIWVVKKLETENPKNSKNVEVEQVKKKKTIPAKTKKSNSYSNGTLSSEVIINEIMVNPSGTDQQQEWIEIYNPGEKEINLGNWKLDDTDGQSKAYVLNSNISIKPHQYLVIYSKDSKLSLGNKQDKVRLINYKNELINEIEYNESFENKSYSRIRLIKYSEENIEENEIKWEWVNDKTPGEENPLYYEFEGFISTEAQFEKEYYFYFQTKTGENLKVIFDENLVQGPIARASFLKGNKIKVTGTIDPKGENKILNLKHYEIIDTTQQSGSENHDYSLIIRAGVIIGVSALSYAIIKKVKWKKSISS